MASRIKRPASWPKLSIGVGAAHAGTRAFALSCCRSGNHCSPPYMDCADTWKPFTLASVSSKYFDGVRHSELCTELLLEEVCRDLSAILVDLEGAEEEAAEKRAHVRT